MTRLLRLAVKSVVDVSALNFSYIMTQNLFELENDVLVFIADGTSGRIQKQQQSISI